MNNATHEFLVTLATEAARERGFQDGFATGKLAGRAAQVGKAARQSDQVADDVLQVEARLARLALSDSKRDAEWLDWHEMVVGDWS